MRLFDRIAQCRIPVLIRRTADAGVTRLSGAADYAAELTNCPVRYVLTDDLVRLCTELAYSKGARTLACADLLYFPATRLWVEWAQAPQRETLAACRATDSHEQATDAFGRRGAWIRASSDGRRGVVRTFWTVGPSDTDILASSMEAYFDLDTCTEQPDPFDGDGEGSLAVFEHEDSQADLLRRCFRFRYEKSWAAYYASATLSPLKQQAIARSALGTIAIDVPVLIAFFLLLGTHGGLPQRPLSLTRLNRTRARSGKPLLLDHVEVLSPLLQPHCPGASEPSTGYRRSPRLHHVRGHLFRRGNQLFWRVPHLRGTARAGAIRSRTVTWTFDGHSARSSPS